MKRKLLNSVIHAKMLYGARIWVEAMQRKWTRQKLGYLQRQRAMRIASSYSTVSESAVLVLTSTSPIDLLAMERQEIYLEMKRGDASSENGDRKAEIKKMAREWLVEKWHQRWDSETTGWWTHTLIPKLRIWVDRTQGQMGYYLTQAMTGHGKFNAYLKRIKKRASAECTYCRCDPDDVPHSVRVFATKKMK